MENNPLDKGVSAERPAGLGPATRARVHLRARELALIAGHAPPHVSQADYEQAKREVTGESDGDRQEAILDSLSGVKSRNSEPVSSDGQVPESPSEDEDDEGRSESEQFAEAGVEQAEREQILQAAQAAEKSDRSEP